MSRAIANNGPRVRVTNGFLVHKNKITSRYKTRKNVLVRSFRILLLRQRYSADTVSQGFTNLME